MRLERSLQHVAALSPERFEDVRRHLDPDWIEQALHATGTAMIRRRRLPAAQVIWADYWNGAVPQSLYSRTGG
jgi:Insertion element 4 transposase N-terminal